jgi:FkbM family methyltransferase
MRLLPRRLFRRIRALRFDDVICRYMFEHGQVCDFIQVGAYDGVSTDPLHRYVERCGWRGVMLEPQPGPVAQLRRLYKDNSNVVIIEAAVHSERTTRTLYTIDSDAFPSWVREIASFDRQHILRHNYLFPDIGKVIKELRVECIPFDDVLKLNPSRDKIDLLQIDAEGADGYILSLFPFDRHRPAIVHWESKNLSKPEQERVLDLLCGHGYLVARSGSEDMLAVRC